MARINIEEQWWSDPRRSKLARILQSEDMADGRAVRMWRLAQEFWQHGRALVPLKIFSTLEAWEALVECHLAELRGEEVYVCGSSQYLDWAFEEKDKRVRGGKKSAERPRNEKGQLMAVLDPTNVQVEPKWNPSEASNVQVSGSGSGSSSSKELRKGESKAAEPLPSLAEVWNEHCGELGQVRKTNTQRNRKADKLWRENNPEEWVEIVQRVARSPFLTGKNERGWKATFDWLLQPESHLRVMEGKYDDTGGTGGKEESFADYLARKERGDA